MRKVILNLAISLDGFIEGSNGEYDWCFTDQDYGMREFLERVDTIFFGRKSYELLMLTEENPYPDKKKYVFSQRLKALENDALLISKDAEREVKSIKNETGKDIWLFGGAILIISLMNLGLIDELQLSIHPILLGAGKPLFKNIEKRINLKLIDEKTYSTGLVQLFYQFK